MSDTLKERLNSHSNSLKSLLSLIPAKYYYDEESKEQWNRKKGTKQDAQQAKRAKLDPARGSSALDETNRREQQYGAGESDSDVSEASVIFDDAGNEIVLDGEAQSKDTESPVTVPKQKTTKPEPAAPKTPKGDGKSQSTNGTALKGSLEKTVPSEEKESPATATPAVPANDAANSTGANDSATQASQTKKKRALPLRDSEGIKALRQKLADKINEMKAQRKAPGSSAQGAPKSREQLLAARKQRQQERVLKRKRDEGGAKDNELESSDYQDDLTDAAPVRGVSSVTDDVSFGQIQFNDGQKLDSNMHLQELRKLKRRNAIDQLKVLETRKHKLEQLDEEKRKEVGERAEWSRAVLMSEGAKLKDNEKLLKKTVKQQSKRKKKSEREWKERIDNVAKGIASREAKRDANLAARRAGKLDKGKKKKRAGFEGKRGKR